MLVTNPAGQVQATQTELLHQELVPSPPPEDGARPVRQYSYTSPLIADAQATYQETAEGRHTFHNGVMQLITFFSFALGTQLVEKGSIETTDLAQRLGMVIAKHAPNPEKYGLPKNYNLADSCNDGIPPESIKKFRRAVESHTLAADIFATQLGAILSGMDLGTPPTSAAITEAGTPFKALVQTATAYGPRGITRAKPIQRRTRVPSEIEATQTGMVLAQEA